MKTVGAINKIKRGFLWCGKAEANGGNCGVAWDSVFLPKWVGGLGIPDIRWLNIACRLGGHGCEEWMNLDHGGSSISQYQMNRLSYF